MYVDKKSIPRLETTFRMASDQDNAKTGTDIPFLLSTNQLYSFKNKQKKQKNTLLLCTLPYL